MKSEKGTPKLSVLTISGLNKYLSRLEKEDQERDKKTIFHFLAGAHCQEDDEPAQVALRNQEI